MTMTAEGADEQALVALLNVHHDDDEEEDEQYEDESEVDEGDSGEEESSGEEVEEEEEGGSDDGSSEAEEEGEEEEESDGDSDNGESSDGDDDDGDKHRSRTRGTRTAKKSALRTPQEGKKATPASRSSSKRVKKPPTPKKVVSVSDNEDDDDQEERKIMDVTDDIYNRDAVLRHTLSLLNLPTSCRDKLLPEIKPTSIPNFASELRSFAAAVIPQSVCDGIEKRLYQFMGRASGKGVKPVYRLRTPNNKSKMAYNSFLDDLLRDKREVEFFVSLLVPKSDAYQMLGKDGDVSAIFDGKGKNGFIACRFRKDDTSGEYIASLEMIVYTYKNPVHCRLLLASAIYMLKHAWSKVTRVELEVLHRSQTQKDTTLVSAAMLIGFEIVDARAETTPGKANADIDTVFSTMMAFDMSTYDEKNIERTAQQTTNSPDISQYFSSADQANTGDDERTNVKMDIEPASTVIGEEDSGDDEQGDTEAQAERVPSTKRRMARKRKRGSSTTSQTDNQTNADEEQLEEEGEAASQRDRKRTFTDILSPRHKKKSRTDSGPQRFLSSGDAVGDNAEDPDVFEDIMKSVAEATKNREEQIIEHCRASNRELAKYMLEREKKVVSENAQLKIEIAQLKDGEETSGAWKKRYGELEQKYEGLVEENEKFLAMFAQFTKGVGSLKSS